MTMSEPSLDLAAPESINVQPSSPYAPADPRDMVALASQVLGAADHGDLVWGHASMRDPDDRGVWMKASSWGFSEVTRDRVLLVGRDGTVLSGTGSRHA